MLILARLSASSVSVLRHDPVEEQHIGRNRIDFVGCERLRRVQRHGAAHIVEQRRRVGPEAADGLDRLLVAQRADAADQPVHRLALAVGAVAGGAFGGEDRLALSHIAAPGRQSGPVGRHVDVPAGDLLRRRLSADAVALARARDADHQRGGDCEHQAASDSIRHWSPRLQPLRSNSESRCNDSRNERRAI